MSKKSKIPHRDSSVSRARCKGSTHPGPLALAITLAVVLYGATAQAEGGATGYLNSAHEYEKQNNFAAAQVQLRNAVQADPGNVAIRLELARVYLKLGNPNAAEAEVFAAHLRGAKEAETAPLIAQAEFESGEFGNVLKDAPVGNRSPKVESLVRAYRGMAELALGETDNAQKSLADAERLDSNSVLVKIASARLALAQHKLQDAAQKADQILLISHDNSDALEIKGMVSVLNGKADDAARFFDAAIAANSRNVRALLDRAVFEISRNQLDKALADIKAAQAVAPGNPVALLLAAQIDLMKGKIPEASSLLDRLRDFMPNMPQAYLLDAEVKLRRNLPGQAEDDLNKFIVRSPDNPKAYQLLGILAMRRGDMGRAISMLEHAQTIAPKDVATLRLLGQAYLTRGENQKAVQVLGQAVALSPNDAKLKTAYAIGQFATGDSVTALTQLGNIFKNGSGDIIAGPPLVLDALRFGRVDMASAAAQALVKRDANNALYLQLLAAVRVAQNNFPAAEEILRGVLNRHPDYVASRMDLAQIYVVTNRPNDAIKLFQDALNKNPKDAATIQAFASIELRLHREAEALKLLSQAQELVPGDPSPTLKIVAVYESQRNWSEALRRAQALQAKFPKNSEVADALGRIYVESGDINKAVAIYEAAAAKFPKSGAILVHYAGALEAKKSYVKALAAATNALTLDPGNAELKSGIVRLTLLTQGADAATRKAEALTPAGFPNEPGAAIMVIRVLEAIGRRQDALSLADQWQSQNPSGKMSAILAGLYQRSGKAARGQALLESWVQSHNDDAEARFGLAQLYDAMGKIDEAIVQYEWLEVKLPNDPSILNNLALLYDRKHDPRARGVAQKAETLAPNSGAVADTYGWILLHQGDRFHGLAFLAKASQAMPDDLTTQYHLASALAQNGKTEDARRVLREILRSNPPAEIGTQSKQLLASLGSAHK